MAATVYAPEDPVLGVSLERPVRDADSRLKYLEQQVALLKTRSVQEQSRAMPSCQTFGCSPFSSSKIIRLEENPGLQSARKVAFIFLNVIGCISAPKIYFLGFVAGYAWNLCKTFFDMTEENSDIVCQDACGSTLAFNLAQISVNPVLELAVTTLSAIEHMAHHSHLSFLKTFSHMGLSQFLTGASLGFVFFESLQNSTESSAQDPVNELN